MTGGPPAIPQVSVIIPAHNEERVIGACLTQLLDGLDPGQAEIIVVCNGCTDRTAARARAAGPTVSIAELTTASKPAALNRGDELATVFPRVYLDADVLMTGRDLRALTETLTTPGGPLAAAPTPRVDAGGRPWTVRAFYKVWTQLPYFTESLIGSGVYAVSEAGRARFDRFPPIIADDRFVYRHFSAGERVRVATAEFRLAPPANLREMLLVQGRRRAGNIEWARTYPDASPQTASPSSTPVLRRMMRDPRLWPSLAVYCVVVAGGWVKGYWKVTFGEITEWERSEGSRQLPIPASNLKSTGQQGRYRQS